MTPVEPETFGPYRLVECIGRGGMGEVYRAVDTRRGRTVALKRLIGTLAADGDFIARFRRESALAARLSDPHIVPIHDFGEIDGRLYLDMRLVEGQDLGELLRRHGPLPPERAVAVVEQLAEALDAAHAAGLVHRDVKPSNALVTPGGFVYLVDFGIARAVDDSTGMTATGATVGTLDYMAPERFDAGPVDHRVDVYSLACVLHEVLVGEKPFPVTGSIAMIGAHVHAPPPRPSARRPGVPPSFDAVIARGMAKRPGQRPPSAGALAAEARRALEAPTGMPPRPLPPPVPAPPPPPPPPAPPRRRVPLAIAATVAAVAAVLVAAVLVVPRLTGGTASPQAPTTTVAAPPTTQAPAGPVTVTLPQPSAIAVTPDGRTAFAVAERSTALVDLATGSVRASVPVGGYAAAVTPDGTRLVVVDEDQGVLRVLSATDGAQLGEVDVGSSGGGLGIAPDGATAYVATLSTVAVVDLAGPAVTGRVDLGNAPYAATFGNGYVYVTWVELQNSGDGALVTVDPRTLKETNRVGLSPWVMPLAMAGSRVLVGARDAMWVVTPGLGDTLRVPGVVPIAVAGSADGTRGYGLYPGGIAVVDPATAQVVDQVPVPGAAGAPVPKQPGALAVTADGRAVVGTTAGISIVSVAGL